MNNTFGSKHRKYHFIIRASSQAELEKACPPELVEALVLKSLNREFDLLASGVKSPQCFVPLSILKGPAPH